MFDDFFIRALFAGIGIAFVTGPLGCFVVWRRLSYFVDTLSHSALLGVTMAYTLDLNIAISVFLISSVIALILIQLQKKTNLPGDALLGLLAHSSLAVGLVVIGFLTFIRFDIMGLLFGDILAVTTDDLIIIWTGGALILLVLDEPVQGVDYTGEIALYELIKRISDTLNCGILLISHDLHTVMTATDHVVCLNGHVCCSGSPMDVAKNNEYKTLFGEQASQILSVYEHKHDHVHSDKGEIKKN